VSELVSLPALCKRTVHQSTSLRRGGGPPARCALPGPFRSGIPWLGRNPALRGVRWKSALWKGQRLLHRLGPDDGRHHVPLLATGRPSAGRWQLASQGTDGRRKFSVIG
jgi:hypothetical protein